MLRRRERDLTRITIEFALFRESDPSCDRCEVVWNGAPGRLLWVEDPVWRFDVLADAGRTSALDVFGAFVRHGVEHILSGFDHVAFVVALVLGARRLRPVLVVVTAFTLAHSISLAAAAFKVVVLPASLVDPPSRCRSAWVAARKPVEPRRACAVDRGVRVQARACCSVSRARSARRSRPEPHQLSALAGFQPGASRPGPVAVVGALLLAFAAARALARAAASSTKPTEDGSGEFEAALGVQRGVARRGRPRRLLVRGTRRFLNADQGIPGQRDAVRPG